MKLKTGILQCRTTIDVKEFRTQTQSSEKMAQASKKLQGTSAKLSPICFGKTASAKIGEPASRMKTDEAGVCQDLNGLKTCLGDIWCHHRWRAPKTKKLNKMKQIIMHTSSHAAYFAFWTMLTENQPLNTLFFFRFNEIWNDCNNCYIQNMSRYIQTNAA